MSKRAYDRGRGDEMTKREKHYKKKGERGGSRKGSGEKAR